MDKNIGKTVFENWKIDSVIGEGSFGKVYRIKRKEMGSEYWAALKIVEFPRENELKRVLGEGRTEEEAREYFRAHANKYIEEVKLMYQLRGDTNIVSFDDHKMTDGKKEIKFTIMLKMELLTPLVEWLRERKLTREDVVKLGVDITRALESCAKLKIIHRDVKPENIFVSKQGNFKLGDFGAARTLERTTSGLSKTGTPLYMAPEIQNNLPYGPTVDTYSLGLVLYKLVNNNRLPFFPEPPVPVLGDDEEAAMRKRMSGEKLPRPARAGGKLAPIILKATAFDVNDRYRNPTEFKKDLEKLQNARGMTEVVLLNANVVAGSGTVSATGGEEENGGKAGTVRAGNEEGQDNSQTIRAEVDAEAAAAARSEQKKIDLDKETGEKAKKRKRLVLLIGGVLLALVAIVLGIVFLREESAVAEFATETATYQVGESDDLLLRISSVAREELTWETGDEGVVAVDESGRVTARGVGKTDVKILFRDKILDTLSVEVLTNIVEVAQINLNQTEVRLKVSEEFMLQTEIIPEDASNKELIYKSENTAVAGVDNGKITGVNPGEVKIIVTDFRERTRVDVLVVVESAPNGGAGSSSGGGSSNNGGGSSSGGQQPTASKPSSGGSTPARNKVIQYRYRDKTTKTSSSASETGWTYQSEAWGAWGGWSGWSRTNPGGNNETRNVENKQVADQTTYRNEHHWKYRRYYCGRTSVWNYDRGCGSWQNIDITWALQPKGDCGVGNCTKYGSYDYNGTGNNDYWFPNGEYDKQIANPTTYHTEYRYQTRSKVYTLWKWGDWSGWSTTKVNKSDARDVEEREIVE